MKNLENLTYFILRNKAFNSENSQGRRNPEKTDLIFDCFWKDIQKILNSESWRRLGDKTQVFALTKNAGIRNRLTHSLEVCSIAETIAIILGLNINLVKSISLAHDIGHTPFGHLGEDFLTEASGQKFCHEKFGVILAQYIEDQGNGLNLSYETLQGILHHRGYGKIDLKPNDDILLEYNVVMLADKIAYAFSDIEDAIILEKIDKNLIPKELWDLGKNRQEQINTCIKGICTESVKKISFKNSKEAKKFKVIREWMYENIYFKLDKGDERKKIKEEMEKTYQFINKYINNQKEYNPIYILAIMTDNEVMEIANLCKKEIKVGDFGKIMKMNFFKIVPYCLKNLT